MGDRLKLTERIGALETVMTKQLEPEYNDWPHIESQEDPQTETPLEAQYQSILKPQTESELNLKMNTCLQCGKDNTTEDELESIWKQSMYLIHLSGTTAYFVVRTI